MYGWNSAPTKAKFKEINQTGSGDAITTAMAVFEVGYGIYEVALPVPTERPDDWEPPALTWSQPYRRDHDVKSALPNLDIDGDTIRIPVTDMVPMILDRLDPADLARALWQNDEVKAAFMDCLVTRYNEQGIGDADRRKFLHGVMEAVHSKALDRLASSTAKLEYEANRTAHYSSEIHRINKVLRDQNVLVHREFLNDKTKQFETKLVPLQFDELEHKLDANGNHARGDLAIGGRSWEEAREFWRKEVLKQFPTPEAPGELAPDAEAVF
jgi:hypothetical protein